MTIDPPLVLCWIWAVIAGWRAVAATPPSQKVEATPRRPLQNCRLLSAGKIAPGAAHPLFGDVASPLLFACAACYGKSDSPLASGMNWGIFTLMGVILTVLTCITLFFVHVIRGEQAQIESDKNPPPPNPPKV